MRSQRRTFANGAGSNLSAIVDLPLDTEPLAFALLSHCFTCSKNFKIIANISRALTRSGIAVLRFDFTGLGDSEGDFSETNFSTNVADIVAAARFLEAEYAAPSLLIGHSLGGTAMLGAAAQVPSATAVVTLASPSDPIHVTKHFAAAMEEIAARGSAQIQVSGRSYTIKRQFVEDLQAFSLDAAIGDLGKSLLVCHSPEDEVVDIVNATRIFQAARHPKSFVSLNRADHMISEQADGLYVGALIAAWALQCVGDQEMEGGGQAKTPTTHPVGDQPHQVVVETGTHYQTEILAGGHEMTADEPAALGGGDTGPTPYDYLVAALGACTSITLRMYADRKGWPLQAVRVRLDHEKVHARDCGSCETEQGRVDRIDREVELIGPLDPQQRQRLLEIASRCPVHRTLESEVVVDTRLVPQRASAG